MDESTTSIDGTTTRKVPLEDLPKEELLKKYKGLLTIAQKAKQSKDAVIEENSRLKEQLHEKEATINYAGQEIIDSLTQQKLDLVTQVEALKHQLKTLNSNLVSNENTLSSTLTRNSELEIENQSYKRQVNRLTDENEDLIAQLDQLEKQISELNQLGIEQKHLLLELEKNNATLTSENCALKNEISNIEMEASKLEELAQLQKMLNVSLEEVKNLQSENGFLQETVSSLKQSLSENETIQLLKSSLLETESLNMKYKEEIKEKNLQLEMYVNSTDDLNVELHRNKAIVEKLKQDIVNTNTKLSDNQIISSGVTSDLQNSNEKLREKLKFFHSKLVKFAGNVKLLKQDKNILIANFKEYTDQVVLWKTQLETVSVKLSEELGSITAEKQKLQEENEALVRNNEQLVKELSDFKINNQSSETETLKNSNKELKEQINELIKEIAELKSTTEKLILEREGLNERIKKTGQLEIQIKNLEALETAYRNKINDLEKTVCELRQQLNAETNKTITLKETMEEIKKQLELAESKCLQQKQASDELNKLIQELETEKMELSRIPELENRLKELTCQLESAKLTETQLAEKSSQEIIKLVQQNKELQELNSDLSSKLCYSKSINEVYVQTDGESNDSEEKISLLRRENAELLTEMNEMNQALKERGETISKQQAYCDEMVKKLQMYETQANQNVSSIALKEETIKNLQEELTTIKVSVSGGEKDLQAMVAIKDEEIRRLQIEIERLSKDANYYAESETLSTSTYSRTEEVNRLKDLEGSWEERYGKLRTLAIKLKGKIRELTAELTKEQNEKGDIQQKLGNSIKTVQTLQTKCDQLEDALEASRTENKHYLKKIDALALDISKDKQNLATNDETITKLKSEIEQLSKDKASIQLWKEQVSSKVQTLKKELEANSLLKKDFEQRIATLSSALEEKDQALNAEIARHKLTMNSLQVSKHESKKKLVLNLEMQDYERSVKELSQKLENEKEVINKLKNQVDSQRSTISALREQNKLLEERTQAQEADFNSLKSEIATYKKKTNDLEDVIAQKDSKIQLLTQNLEETRLENEELSTELSKVIAEHQKIYNALKAEKDYLRSQNLGLEQRLREVQDAFNLKNHELDTIEAEYQAYKVRAQSVLRQNQTRDLGLEEKLHEEVAGLKMQVANLTQELNAYK